VVGGNTGAAYAIESTTNYSNWKVVGFVTNTTGSALFTDTNGPLPVIQYYRARLLP
jgi:hypothetical protein